MKMRNKMQCKRSVTHMKCNVFDLIVCLFHAFVCCILKGYEISQWPKKSESWRLYNINDLDFLKKKKGFLCIELDLASSWTGFLDKSWKCVRQKSFLDIDHGTQTTFLRLKQKTMKKRREIPKKLFSTDNEKKIDWMRSNSYKYMENVFFGYILTLVRC